MAAVIYDMLIRGGAQGEQISAPLAAAYPLAGNIARQYAAYTRSALTHRTRNQRLRPRPHMRVSYGVEYQVRRSGFTLRRVRVSSIALFFGMLAAMLSAMRLAAICGLALSSASASAWGNEELHVLLDELAAEVLGSGPRKEFYVWAYNFFDANLVDLSGSDFSLASLQTHAAPSALVLGVLLTPMTSGLLFYFLGALFGACVNAGLSLIGGIRLFGEEQ